MRRDNNLDPVAANHKFWGEENYKLGSFFMWKSTNGGDSFTQLPNTTTNHRWPDAKSLAFVHDNGVDKLIMPTHGNGVWIGDRTCLISKTAAIADTTAAKESLPKHFSLHQNHPNPFNPTTVIRYDVPSTANIKLVIYDVMGGKVRALLDQEIEAGYHETIWDGLDENSAPVASGIYFYQLHTAAFIKVRKMTLMR